MAFYRCGCFWYKKIIFISLILLWHLGQTFDWQLTEEQQSNQCCCWLTLMWLEKWYNWDCWLCMVMLFSLIDRCGQKRSYHLSQIWLKDYVGVVACGMANDWYGYLCQVYYYVSYWALLYGHTVFYTWKPIWPMLQSSVLLFFFFQFISTIIATSFYA